MPPTDPTTPADAAAVEPKKRTPAQRRKKRDRRRRVRQTESRQAEARRRRLIAAMASTRTHRRTPVRDLANHFGTSERSLYRWRQASQDDPAVWVPLGRPLKTASTEDRCAVWDALCKSGSRIGVPRLRKQFPQLGKREAEEYIKRFKAVEARQNGKLLHRLTWLKPGATWTMDFSAPAAALQKPYRWLLCVRDLSSGRTLAWHAVERDDSATVVAILTALFAKYGPPLVLKSDNGPHFRGKVPAFLKKHGVYQLYSPVYTPSYNGACEAGQGSLKIRAHEFACRAGHPALWTLDDLEGARLQANEAQADQQPVVADATPPLYHCSLGWDPILDCERVAFAKAVRREALKLRKEQTDTTPDKSKRLNKAAARRKAISRACVARDLLTIRRKRVSVHI